MAVRERHVVGKGQIGNWRPRHEATAELPSVRPIRDGLEERVVRKPDCAEAHHRNAVLVKVVAIVHESLDFPFLYAVFLRIAIVGIDARQRLNANVAGRFCGLTHRIIVNGHASAATLYRRRTRAFRTVDGIRANHARTGQLVACNPDTSARTGAVLVVLVHRAGSNPPINRQRTAHIESDGTTSTAIVRATGAARLLRLRRTAIGHARRQTQKSALASVDADSGSRTDGLRIRPSRPLPCNVLPTLALVATQIRVNHRRRRDRQGLGGNPDAVRNRLVIAGSGRRDDSTNAQRNRVCPEACRPVRENKRLRTGGIGRFLAVLHEQRIEAGSGVRQDDSRRTRIRNDNIIARLRHAVIPVLWIIPYRRTSTLPSRRHRLVRRREERLDLPSRANWHRNRRISRRSKSNVASPTKELASLGRRGDKHDRIPLVKPASERCRRRTTIDGYRTTPRNGNPQLMLRTDVPDHIVDEVRRQKTVRQRRPRHRTRIRRGRRAARPHRPLVKRRPRTGLVLARQFPVVHVSRKPRHTETDKIAGRVGRSVFRRKRQSVGGRQFIDEHLDITCRTAQIARLVDRLVPRGFLLVQHAAVHSEGVDFPLELAATGVAADIEIGRERPNHLPCRRSRTLPALTDIISGIGLTVAYRKILPDIRLVCGRPKQIGIGFGAEIPKKMVAGVRKVGRSDVRILRIEKMSRRLRRILLATHVKCQVAPIQIQRRKHRLDIAVVSREVEGIPVPRPGMCLRHRVRQHPVADKIDPALERSVMRQEGSTPVTSGIVFSVQLNDQPALHVRVRAIPICQCGKHKQR